MRVKESPGGPPPFDRFFSDYEMHFRDLDRYEYHLNRLIAEYSRGDQKDQLRNTFRLVVQKVAASEQETRLKFGPQQHLFAHRNQYGELFRDSLVLLTFGLCLGASREEIAALLEPCDRGDPLLETVAAAAAPGLEKPAGEPAFYRLYDRLYDALHSSGQERERLVFDYLGTWYEKMDGFSFKDTHLLEDQTDYVGYWCFEAAGVVAALGIDDSTFAEHPYYPRDLVAFCRTDTR